MNGKEKELTRQGGITLTQHDTNDSDPPGQAAGTQSGRVEVRGLCLFLRLHPAPQGFGDTPGLGNATSGRKRFLSIEDFADRADAGQAQMGD